MEYQIDNIDTNNKGQLYFYINNGIFSQNEFRENFLANFCNTVYKFQGGKIDEHYNIFDTHKMDVKEMYPALSRTTKLEYIHVNWEKLCKYYKERKQDEFVIKNAYFNSDFQNGKIYHVTFELNDKHYVGSTTKTLDEQLNYHKHDKNSAIYKHRNDKPIITLICNSPCKDKKKLEKIENGYINEHKQKYGELLLNVKGVKKEKKKKVEFKVEMETQKQLEDRLEKFGYKLRIKDDSIRSYLEIDARVDGKRVHHIRRYNENNKQEAFKQLSEIQQKCIQELTIDWE